MGVVTFETLCLQAKQAIAERDWETARQIYLQALGLKSDAPDVHYGLATVCFQLRDLPSAAYHFKEVTRLDPLRPSAFINLGAVHNLLDQLDEAVTALRRGIQLDPKRAEGYYNLGLVYRRKGQADLAIQAYKEALRINPRMADTHYNLGNVYLETEQYRQALEHYRKALEIRPGWEKAMDGLTEAEAILAESQAAPETPSPSSTGSASVVEAVRTKPEIDPSLMVNPAAHGSALSSLHRATIESEELGRQFLEVVVGEIEPAIKELSSCLLYADGPVSELDACVQRFENAVQNMRNAQSNLATSMLRLRTLSDTLIKD
jgi:tetratricopeptide (TPR) repeat protein